MAPLEYNLSRPYSKWYRITVAILLGFWVIFITLFNVAAVGYETVTTFSPNYNNTNILWYERLLPNRLRPTTRGCTGKTIHLGDGYSTTFHRKH